MQPQFLQFVFFTSFQLEFAQSRCFPEKKNWASNVNFVHTYALGSWVAHVPQVVVVVVAAVEVAVVEVADVESEGLVLRLSQCAYGPPWWLSDRRPCADSVPLHRQALLQSNQRE